MSVMGSSQGDQESDLGLRQTLLDCRAQTLALVDQLESSYVKRQAHPDFSPVGWHLGHIAYTESLWLLEKLAGQPCRYPQYRKLFAADGLPKAERENVPELSVLLAYMGEIRAAVLEVLAQGQADQSIRALAGKPELSSDWANQRRFWYWMVQHEVQHVETMTFLLELHRLQALMMAPADRADPESPTIGLPEPRHEMVYVPAGEITLGWDGIAALDNEQPVQPVQMTAFWLDRYPVTCEQYGAFIQAGGYDNPVWWSAAGWQWRQQANVTQPLYWRDKAVDAHHPVCGVSAYEADAYARFVGKRLPTEWEWETAARWHPQDQQVSLYPWGDQPPSAERANFQHAIGQTTAVNAHPSGQSAVGCDDLLGNVWEWTASWFQPYSGFEVFPYPGYSQIYFDGQHRVLRGGSWATGGWGLRSSFRNWYHPHVRQILAGFRCAQDDQSGG